jgi:hypothetical protein
LVPRSMIVDDCIEEKYPSLLRFHQNLWMALGYRFENSFFQDNVSI